MRKLKNRFEIFFGANDLEVNQRNDAKKLLLNIVTTIQSEMIDRIQRENSYDMFMKLYYIFDEVHAFYLDEKEARAELSKINVHNQSAFDIFEENRNIMRNIIDACNIWIENCVFIST